MKVKRFSVTCILVCCVFLLSTLTGWMNKPAPINTDKIRQPVTKSILLLQKSAYIFTSNSTFKCASCHHNTLAAMATPTFFDNTCGSFWADNF